MMTFQDIFSSNLLDRMVSYSLLDTSVGLILAFLLGLFIYFIYRKTYSGVMYATSFGVTLIALTMITAMLIMTIASNIILSLGMVGALSIVRFRTAIKDPMDIAFLFWSIAVGIVVAAGFFPLAVFGSALIGLMLYVFSKQQLFDSPYILLIRLSDPEVEGQVRDYVSSNVKKMKLKSKNASGRSMELNYEVRLSGDDSRFISELDKITGVDDVVLVSYSGDYMG